MFYTYMLRCEDNSIYTGITTDVNRRMDEHFNKDKKCAKYTKIHCAKELECVWQTETRVYASKLEYCIKRLSKKEKEILIKNNNEFAKLLGDKLETERYKLIKKSREA